MNFSKFFSVFSVFSGMGGIGTLSTYVGTKKTIGDELSNKCLKETVMNTQENDIWKKVFEKPINKTNSLFQEVKDSTSLREKCIEAYKNTYYSIFSKENEELKNATLTNCSISIADSLETLKLEKNSYDSISEEIITKIKDNSLIKDSHLLQVKELIKEKTPNTEAWNELKKWCESNLKENYLGDTDDWKLTKEYCLKNKGS